MPKKKLCLDKQTFSDCTNKQLREELKKRNLKRTGKKIEMIARLTDYEKEIKEKDMLKCMEFLCELNLTQHDSENKNVTDENRDKVRSCQEKVFYGENRHKKLQCPGFLDGKRFGAYKLFTPQEKNPLPLSVEEFVSIYETLGSNEEKQALLQELSPNNKEKVSAKILKIRFKDDPLRELLMAVLPVEELGNMVVDYVKETKFELEKTLHRHTDNVNSVAFSADGQRIVSGSFDDTIKVWDAQSGQLLQTLKDKNKVFSVAFSPDGKRIVSGGGDHTVKVWKS